MRVARRWIKTSNQKFQLEKLKVGTEIPPMIETVENKKYMRYNRIIGEINPIHFNKAYATKLGFDNVVVAGNFLFTYIPKWLINWMGNASAIKKIDIEFGNPVYIDDQIVHKGKILDIRREKDQTTVECDFWVEKPSGVRTSKGCIFLAFKKK